MQVTVKELGLVLFYAVKQIFYADTLFFPKQLFVLNYVQLYSHANGDYIFESKN